MPAMVALIAGNFTGADRKVAYAVLAGSQVPASRGRADPGRVGDHRLSLEVVFIGEVVDRRGHPGDEPRRCSMRYAPDPLRSSTCWAACSRRGSGHGRVWAPCSRAPGASSSRRTPPSSRSGFALTPFVIAGGGACCGRSLPGNVTVRRPATIRWCTWTCRRCPCCDRAWADCWPRTSSSWVCSSIVPLYLQLVLGWTRSRPASRCCPCRSRCSWPRRIGSRLSGRFAVRSIVRAGLGTIVVAVVVLWATIEPDARRGLVRPLHGRARHRHGLVASQLGNVVQSSSTSRVAARPAGCSSPGSSWARRWVSPDRAIVLAGLTNGFVRLIEDDPAIADEVAHR